MGLYKRKDSANWWARFTVDGRRVSFSTGTADKQQAQQYHDKAKAEAWEQQRLGVKPKRMWQEAVVRWLDEKQHKASIRDDVAKFRWLDPFFGSRALTELTRDRIHQVIETKRRETTPATANRYAALIRSVLRAAERDWEWIDKAPRVKLLPEPLAEPRWLRPAEVSRVLAELPEHQRDMALFGLLTGLRQGNVKALRWDMVDLDRRLAVIPARSAKGRRAIPVPLSDAAVELLRRQVGRHAEAVFTYRGQPVSQVNTRAWRQALQRAGVKARWHDLRHTFASWHAQSGTADRELQELGGWQSISMVRRYAHLAPEHLRAAAERVGTVVATAATEEWLPELGSNQRPAD